MERPCEWTRVWHNGRNMVKHKGTGVIRENMRFIGDLFGRAASVGRKAKKAATSAAEKAAEKSVEKGSKKIKSILRRPAAARPTPTPARKPAPDWVALNRLLSEDYFFYYNI